MSLVLISSFIQPPPCSLFPTITLKFLARELGNQGKENITQNWHQPCFLPVGSGIKGSWYFF